MKTVATFAGLLLSCLLVLPAGAQETVYKWVDADGIPHYSDQPPPSIDAEALPIRYRRTDRAAVQASVREQADLRVAASQREADEATEEESGEQAREQVRSERQAICEQARARVASYENARRLYKPGPDGERIYLTDEELDQERAAALGAVREWCD